MNVLVELNLGLDVVDDLLALSCTHCQPGVLIDPGQRAAVRQAGQVLAQHGVPEGPRPCQLGGVALRHDQQLAYL